LISEKTLILSKSVARYSYYSEMLGFCQERKMEMYGKKEKNGNFSFPFQKPIKARGLGE
jgi:hypothetical protein